VLSVTAIRRVVVAAPAYGLVKSILPRVSRTEQEALDAGTVGWMPSCSQAGRAGQAARYPQGDADRRRAAFLDGPVNKVCSMIDDWDVRHNRADLSPEVWAYLKEQGFLGMLIGKEYGGLGFSAQAQSQVVSKVASRSSQPHHRDGSQLARAGRAA